MNNSLQIVSYVIGTQTHATTNPVKTFASIQTQTTSDHIQSSDEESDQEDQYKGEIQDSQDSSDYSPTEESDSESSSSDNERPGPNSQENIEKNWQKESKFIVFFSALLRLLSWCSCPSCGHKDLSHSRREIGTLLIITLLCHSCGKTTTWHSQPYLGTIPAGNILLSSAILFAGASITKVLRILSFMSVAAISSRTFFRHQKDILFKTIRQAWSDNQEWLLGAIHGHEKRLVCGGDGRADSPGHCAKFGTYTLIELQEKVVLDVQLVQVNKRI